MAVRFGECVFDKELLRLTRAGAPVHLTPKAFQLLELLIDHRPRPLAKRFLIDVLWPDVIVEEANVRNLVAEVRSAIGDSETAQLIRTVPRFGYAFEAAVNGDASPALPWQPRLHGRNRDYSLVPGENVLGRDPSCSVMLDDNLVSRRHAVVRVAGNTATIEDLGSRNGTIVNGRRADGTTELNDGDELELGPVKLTVRLINRTQPTQPMPC